MNNIYSRPFNIFEELDFAVRMHCFSFLDFEELNKMTEISKLFNKYVFEELSQKMNKSDIFFDLNSFSFADFSMIGNEYKIKKISFDFVLDNANFFKEGFSRFLNENNHFFLDTEDKNSVAIEKFLKTGYNREIKTLTIKNNFTKEDILFLIENFPKLTSLDLSQCEKIENLELLKNFPNLNYLNLQTDSIRVVEQFEFLKELKNLKELKINYFDYSSVEYLLSCENLTSLTIEQNQGFLNLDFLEKFPNLTELCLLSCQSLEDITGLKHCRELNTLVLKDCLQIQDVSSLTYCKKLTFLDLEGCSSVENANELKNLENIKKLNLSNCKRIKNFDFLESFLKIEDLNLSKCNQVKSSTFHSFFKLKKLNRLTLIGCKNLESVENLIYCDIKYLDLTKCDKINRKEVEKMFSKSHPSLKIQFPDPKSPSPNAQQLFIGTRISSIDFSTPQSLVLNGGSITSLNSQQAPVSSLRSQNSIKTISFGGFASSNSQQVPSSSSIGKKRNRENLDKSEQSKEKRQKKD